MRRLWLFNAPAGVLRWLVFCAGCCSALPGCPFALPGLLRRCPAGCFPMEFCSNAPASNSSVTVSTASSIFPIALRCSAPASNKPHSAEKSTPVWLTIWRIWAGFANSQHRYAAFTTPDNICAHSSLLPPWSCCSDRRKSLGPSAPIAYATSVSPPNEAIAWPGAQVSDGW